MGFAVALLAGTVVELGAELGSYIENAHRRIVEVIFQPIRGHQIFGMSERHKEVLPAAGGRAPRTNPKIRPFCPRSGHRRRQNEWGRP